MTSMRDLIARVNADPRYTSSVEKGAALMKAIHPEDRLKGMHALAQLVFALPRELATTTGTPEPPQRCTICAAKADRQAQVSANTRGAKHVDTARKKIAHASPKILAARAAWQEWLNTSVVIPGTNTRLAIGDMTTDQLQTVANALYDASLQLHALADAITEAGADTARDLTDEAAALVLEAAA